MKVLLATAVVAAMLTVPGQAVAATTPDQPSTGSELAVPRQAAAMQNDLGLTEQQMDQRLKAESAATKLVPTAQRAAGSAFGGVWYDAARQKLIVGVTNPKAAAAVRATGAEASVVPVSAKQLDQRVNGIYLPGDYVGYIQNGSPAEIRTNPAYNKYWL